MLWAGGCDGGECRGREAPAAPAREAEVVAREASGAWGGSEALLGSSGSVLKPVPKNRE